MDRGAVEDWIRAYVKPISAIEPAHERPWSTVLRVPLADRCLVQGVRARASLRAAAYG
jgi:hypothetical protein